ncbi:zinc finger MYM-type protein 1-like [Montipora capricornis]|uniref:zinc finger MYM-type protein 1-like n=1 Tax=Montipora capricornis TaxID=246305 RepID=UPI0035F10574
MVRERNQSQLAFFTKSSTESQLSHKLSRSDIQNDVHYQEDIRNESTGTTHGNHSSKPATSSSISDNSTGNGKESVPLGSEQSPLSSSNVLAHVIQKVEIPPASVPLEQGDDRDVQKTIYEREPSLPRIDNVASEPEKEMIVALQRDGHTAREPRPAVREGPLQPVLREYKPQKFGNETFTRDLKAQWFKQYPWLSYSIDRKMQRKSSSIISIIDDGHRNYVKRNREFLRVIIECLFYTAQQNIAQRGHEEDRSNLGQRSDVNRGNFLELLHLRSKDIPWLEEKLNTQLQDHAQWTSPTIQNELLQIFPDLIIELICKDVRESRWYGIIIDETSDISRDEQVSFCLSYLANGTKKEAFVGFHATKTTDGEALYKLVKEVMNDLQLELQNIVGECFDGASNMSGVNKGLSARMKECSPLAIYVHCYGHLLNLALQDTLTTVEPLRNTLGTIQSLYNFLEASPKRHALFRDIETEEGNLVKTLKSQSVTRWSCRWEAVKAVDQQLERIVKALLVLSTDKDVKTYSESRSLLHAICDFQFILGLCVLKIILSNTSSLSAYLQGKTVDVVTARRNANLTLETLRSCRNEESFKSVWKLCECVCNKVRSWINDTDFSFRDARVPRRQTSTRLQALVGENPSHNAQSKPEDFHRVNTYFTSLDKVLAEIEARFGGNDQDVLCALGDITLSDSPAIRSFNLVSSYYSLDRDLLQADQRLFCQFKKAHLEPKSLKTAADVIETLHANRLFEMVPEFSKVVSILAVIPATSCSAERSFSRLRRLKTYLRSTMGQSRLNSLAIISIERAYGNRVIVDSIDKIIDTFGQRHGRRSYFF